MYQGLSNIFILSQETSEDCVDAKESVTSVITLSDNIIEKVYEEQNDGDTSKFDESIKDVDDTISNSSDTDIACNDTSVNSTSDTGILKNTTPPSKKLTSQQLLKKQESAKKKNEERERIKQVSCILYITSQAINCITMFLSCFFF